MKQTYQGALARILALFAVFVVTFSANAQPPSVVVSISPIHSLVSSVMAGVSEPLLLTRPGESPHTGALRPSQLRMLNNADLIIWVGPALEQGLVRYFDIQTGNATVVALTEAAGVEILPSRESGAWSDHGSDHQSHSGELTGIDPHLWLSFSNAGAIVDLVAGKLILLDPANRARYRSNASETVSHLIELEELLRRRLQPVAALPYVVFHDAYQYFEKQFDLHPVGSLSVNPHRPPGARRVIEIQQAIREQQVTCIFSEPQFEPALVNTLVSESGVKTGILDPMGAGLPPGPQSWYLQMERMTESLRECLQP